MDEIVNCSFRGHDMVRSTFTDISQVVDSCFYTIFDRKSIHQQASSEFKIHLLESISSGVGFNLFRYFLF